MQDITLAADETAATRLVHDGETFFGTPSKSGSGNLGPFFANYTVSASISGGTVSLHAPNIIELNKIHLNYSLSLTFGIDLNNFLPHFCLPQVLRQHTLRRRNLYAENLPELADDFRAAELF